MRTKITLVLLLSLYTFAVKAQSSSFNFGLKAAPQISWMKPDTDGYKANGAKIGFAWGFIADFNFTENYSIGTGFNMLFNGGKLTFSDATGTVNREYFLKYIEVPLTLKMRTNEINGTKYFGRIGLGTAFKIGAKKEDEITNAEGIKTNIAKSNFDGAAFVRESLIVGVGAEHEIAEGLKLGLELTFNNGFTNILTEKDVKATPNFFELAFSVIF
ncbi:MAG: porin family protein [Bacteroidales bacterium]|nr:porin family protein [Bacteroidales bacterium]